MRPMPRLALLFRALSVLASSLSLRGRRDAPIFFRLLISSAPPCQSAAVMQGTRFARSRGSCPLILCPGSNIWRLSVTKRTAAEI